MSVTARPTPKAAQASYSHFVSITKSDSANFAEGPCDAIFVGTAGVVVVVRWDGIAVPFTCVAGQIIEVMAIRVNDTNTVPTLMVALYI